MIEMHDNLLSIGNRDYPLVVEQTFHAGSVMKHWHDFYEFVYVDRGFCIHRTENETSIVMMGDVFFVLPGTMHEYWKTVNNCVFNCVFYPRVLGEDFTGVEHLPLLRDIFSADRSVRWKKIHLPTPARFTVARLMQELVRETQDTPPGYQLRAKALLLDFLVTLSRTRGEVTPGILDQGPYSSSDILRSLAYSAEHNTTVEQMAKISGYSVDHFSKLFKKYTGVSPLAYITTMKIAKAANLLLQQDVSISHAAEVSGFEDVNYFSRLFKKETGVTPSEFRAKTLPVQD